MENELKDNLKNFLNQEKEVDKKDDVVVISDSKDGLVERVEKTYILNDGRQLLNN